MTLEVTIGTYHKGITLIELLVTMNTLAAANIYSLGCVRYSNLV